MIRLHTRYRRDLTEERTRDKHRAEKLLESAAIKLSTVVTDLHGVTGRDIMDHLIAGERDPKALAQLARGRARRKICSWKRRWRARSSSPRRSPRCWQAMLARIDRIDADIADLTAVIEQLLAPYEEQLQQAESMPGWGRRAAQDALAETGADMTRFPAGAHLASWAGRDPAGQPVRHPHRPRQSQERQPVPRRHHRRDRRRSRPDPDPRRRPLPAASPPPRQAQSPGRRSATPS